MLEPPLGARDVAARRCRSRSGLVPGVLVGALLLGYDRAAQRQARRVHRAAAADPAPGRRAARWPLAQRTRAPRLPLGAGVGLLYGLTTISGPPLALFWNNQGLAKDDFKVALAIIRSIESVCALIAYAYLGLLTRESAALLPWIVPGVLIGFPLGHALISASASRRSAASA